MIGIDEVGRGAFAGPLLVCAVRSKNKLIIPGLTDSKKLTPLKRQRLAGEILKSSCDIGYGWVSAAEIDKLGITEALKKACKKALTDINANKQEAIILDGNINYLKDYNCKTLIKADCTISEVSAASIVAKFTRDKHMEVLDKKYINYGFNKNKGYGTKYHTEAILKYGLTDEHRRLFVRKLFKNN